MGTLYLQAGGGAGDFVFNYFMSYPWRCIPTIKHHFSDCKIVAVLACHQPSVGELIYTNPEIDGVMAYRWVPPGHPQEYGWKHMVAGQDLGEWAAHNNIREAQDHGLEHKVWLTPEEESLLEDIRGQGKYVVIHPFAGLPHRGCRPHPYDGEYKCYPDYKYIQSANYLAKKGYRVYIIGRSSRDGHDLLRDKKEELIPYDGEPLLPGVVDLINKVSFRVNVELTRRANGFLGTHSSMLSAAWTADVPSVFFYPGYDEHGNKRGVLEYGGTTGTWALHKPIHNYYELTAAEFLKLDPRDPVHKLFECM